LGKDERGGSCARREAGRGQDHIGGDRKACAADAVLSCSAAHNHYRAKYLISAMTASMEGD